MGLIVSLATPKPNLITLTVSNHFDEHCISLIKYASTHLSLSISLKRPTSKNNPVENRDKQSFDKNYS